MAIKSVLEGRKYISPGVTGNVLEGYLDGRKTLKSRSSIDTVTQREKEILKLLGEGGATRTRKFPTACTSA
jgi:two-component system, NarL family, response regulator NreC